MKPYLQVPVLMVPAGGDYAYPTSGLQLLLDAALGVFSDAGTTPAVDTNPVQQWNDQSGNDRHFTQGTEANRPLYDTDGIGGLPSLNFDGTNDLLARTAALSLFKAAGAVTILAVFRHGTAASGELLSETGGYFSIRKNTGPALELFNYSGGDTIASAAIANNTVYLVEAWHAGGQIGIRVNGGAVDTETSGNTDALTGTLRIGNTLDGRVAELAMYNADIGGGPRFQWRNYAAAKYGVAL